MLIAVRADIEADVKRISIRKRAKMVAVEVCIEGKKLFFVQFIEWGL